MQRAVASDDRHPMLLQTGRRPFIAASRMVDSCRWLRLLYHRCVQSIAFMHSGWALISYVKRAAFRVLSLVLHPVLCSVPFLRVNSTYRPSWYTYTVQPSDSAHACSCASSWPPSSRVSRTLTTPRELGTGKISRGRLAAPRQHPRQPSSPRSHRPHRLVQRKHLQVRLLLRHSDVAAGFLRSRNNVAAQRRLQGRIALSRSTGHPGGSYSQGLLQLLRNDAATGAFCCHGTMMCCHFPLQPPLRQETSGAPCCPFVEPLATAETSAERFAVTAVPLRSTLMWPRPSAVMPH
jgi:hypothetical protein